MEEDQWPKIFIVQLDAHEPIIGYSTPIINVLCSERFLASTEVSHAKEGRAMGSKTLRKEEMELGLMVTE